MTSSDPPRRLVLTGGQGFVAGSVIAQAGPDCDLHVLSRGGPLVQRDGVRWHRSASLDSATLARLFREVRPQAVIHTAALANIDFCQANPGLARAVNVDFTRSLADLCADSGAILVFCSTDTIFDGERAPYREEDPPGPVNRYAETKVEAEQLVTRLGDKAVVARLAQVTGMPVLGAGNSFLPQLIASLRAGREVAVAAHEFRTPIDVITVGRALLELAGGGYHGVVHLAGNDRLSRLEMSRRIAVRLGLPAELVKAGPPSDSPRRARRPRDVSLDNSKARAVLRTPMLGFAEALELAFSRSSHPK